MKEQEHYGGADHMGRGIKGGRGRSFARLHSGHNGKSLESEEQMREWVCCEHESASSLDYEAVTPVIVVIARVYWADLVGLVGVPFSLTDSMCILPDAECQVQGVHLS